MRNESIDSLEIQKEEEEEELIKDPKKSEPSLKSKIIIYSIPIIILILVIIGIIIIFKLPKASEEEIIDLPTKGIIKLNYQINSSNLNSDPISEEFIQENEFGFYLEGIKYHYKNFKFARTGECNIELKLYHNKINMDNMFKNIKTLRNIEMKANTNETIYITSLENTFENCISLTSVILLGFDTYEVKSMHKMFSGSGISTFDLSIFDYTNVTYMSYMFANCKSLNNINFNNFYLENIETMSHFLYSCTSFNKYIIW